MNLASNTTVPLLGLLAAPVTSTLGPIAALNLLLRLSLALSAFSLYLVLGRFDLPRWARAFGGLLYGFGPYLIGQASGDAHLDLAFGALPPLLFLLVYEAATGSAGPSPIRRGLLIGGVVAAQFLIDPEVLAQCLLLAGVALFFGALRHRRAVAARAGELARTAFAAIAFGGLIIAYPLFELLFGPGHLRGPVQSVSALQFFSEDLLEPFLPTAREAVAPTAVASLTHFATRNVSELGGYLGIPLAVLLVALVALGRRMLLRSRRSPRRPRVPPGLGEPPRRRRPPQRPSPPRGRPRPPAAAARRRAGALRRRRRPFRRRDRGDRPGPRPRPDARGGTPASWG